MNDLVFMSRPITQSFRNVLQLGVLEGGELLREVRQIGRDEDEFPLINL